MALTPTGEALNRATPGFDALVGVLQNTTNRILQNKQFAKEVQSRKDFAQFQSDLQLQNRLEIMKASGKQQKEIIDYRSDVSIGEAAAIGTIENKLYEERAISDIDRSIENADEIARAEGEAFNVKQSVTQDTRRDNLQMQADIQADKEVDVYKRSAQYRQTNTSQYTIEDAEKDVTSRLSRKLDEDLIQNDPYFQYIEPQITQGVDEEGNPVFQYQPVTVQLSEGSGPEQVPWAFYEDYYVETHKQRKNITDRIKFLLENKSNVIKETGSNGAMGTRELNETLQEIQSISGDYYKLQEYFNNFSGITPDYESAEQKNTIRQFKGDLTKVSTLFEPFESPIVSESFSMKRGITEGSQEYDQFKNQLSGYINNFKWGNIVDVTQEKVNDGDLSDEYTKALLNLTEQLGQINEVPPNFRKMVLNWDYDPNQDATANNKLFLTETEAQNKILKQATGGTNSPDVQKMNETINNPWFQLNTNQYDYNK